MKIEKGAAESGSPRTAEEVEALKASWRRDPHWDLEDTEGFEAHREELAVYSSEQRAEWAREAEESDERYMELDRDQIYQLYHGLDLDDVSGASGIGYCTAAIVDRLDRIAAGIERIAQALEGEEA